MESKEAIERLRGFYNFLASEYPNKHINLMRHKEDTDQVIELIKELNYYKQMWEELEEIRDSTEWEMVSLKEIKEKYLED